MWSAAGVWHGHRWPKTSLPRKLLPVVSTTGGGGVVLKMGMNEGETLWYRYIWYEHRVKIHTMAGWGKDSQMSQALANWLTTHMTAVTLRAPSVVKNSLKAKYLGLPINLYGCGKPSLWNRKRTPVASDSPQSKINEFVCISALRWSVSHFAASLTATHNISSGIIPAWLRRSMPQQVTENIGDIPLADNIKYCPSVTCSNPPAGRYDASPYHRGQRAVKKCKGLSGT